MKGISSLSFVQNVQRNMLKVFILLLSILSLHAYDPSCISPGQCMLGVSVGDAFASSAFACLQSCQENEECSDFTFFASTNLCVLYNSCPQITDSNCVDCYSGSVAECINCYKSGRCLGPVLDTSFAIDPRTCLKKCQETSGCKWYSFNKIDSSCILTNECDFLDETCGATCIHGNSDCDELPSNETGLVNIMVAGGLGDGSSVEIINLDGQTCQKPSGLLAERDRAVSTIIGQDILICGGDSTSGQCYQNTNGIWIRGPELGMPRTGPAAVMLDDARWWITGGAYEFRVHNTTEILEDGGIFTPGPELPYATNDHCLLKINRTHYFLAGGEVEGGYFTSAVYIYDMPSVNWIQVPDMISKREGFVCGKAGDKIVIAGGNFKQGSEIFNLKTLSWEVGPGFPFGDDSFAYFSQTVPYEESFLVIGGDADSDNTFLDTVIQYDPDNNGWIQRPEKLLERRFHHTSTLIPSGHPILDCN